jgi:hypothetical protein
MTRIENILDIVYHTSLDTMDLVRARFTTRSTAKERQVKDAHRAMISALACAAWQIGSRDARSSDPESAWRHLGRMWLIRRATDRMMQARAEEQFGERPNLWFLAADAVEAVAHAALLTGDDPRDAEAIRSTAFAVLDLVRRAQSSGDVSDGSVVALEHAALAIQQWHDAVEGAA